MSSEIERVVGRYREAIGLSHTKIKNALVVAEERKQLIEDEIKSLTTSKKDERIKQILQSKLITTMRLIEDIKKK
jgi:hypothetical protein